MQLIEGALTNSLVVAEVFKKEHGEIVRTIEELEAVVTKESGDTTMFRRSSYEAGGVTRTMYHMNRDGFTLLAMSVGGKRATKFKLAYLKAFNAAESEELGEPERHTLRQMVKKGYRKLMSVVRRELVPTTKRSENEVIVAFSNLINEALGIPTGQRDNLTLEELELLDFAQKNLMASIHALKYLGFEVVLHLVKKELENNIRSLKEVGNEKAV